MCDSEQRAHTSHCKAQTFDEAWRQIASQAQTTARKRKLQVKWLRIDWVTSIEATTWEGLDARLKKTKRGYFRHGLAFDHDLRFALLEMELNANAICYGGNQVEHAVFNHGNFQKYAKRRFNRVPQLDSVEKQAVFILSTKGIFASNVTPPIYLYGPGRNAGRRLVNRLDTSLVTDLVRSSSEFLASQVRSNGRFYYGWHACFDRPINTYNTLRHASSTYAMIEAWEVTESPQLKSAIERALGHLTETLIQRVTLPNGQRVAFLVESNGEVKLGGNAVAILALVKYSQATGSTRYRELLEQLALSIQYMQNPDSGQFLHVLQFPELNVKQAFRIIYYDGEAAFALMRLYGLTKDERWLNVVEKAFDYFIEAGHWRAHDHWLSYCVNELTLYRPEEKYFRFGLQNVADYLDFVENRITTFPTLLELMMAAERMVKRLQQSEKHRHLLDLLDLDHFYRALDKRAYHLLNGYFWPETAMFFQNPGKITGSFFIRHHAFRLRIDDVEHYLSGFVAYREFLLKGGKQVVNQPSRVSDGTAPPASGPNWNRENLLIATGGQWLGQMPAKEWSATGLCVYRGGMKPGNLIALRSQGGNRFIPRSDLSRLPFTPQAILAEGMKDHLSDLPAPVLRVRDVRTAVLDMGKFARKKLTGTVIGITGSAGKTTTVAMLHHLLGPWGGAAKSEANANLPVGIAWNLASIPWQSRFTLVEMAIGSMDKNSALARPHVAVITNIHKAHLEYHKTTEEIAVKKARIFSAMEPGGLAIFNRDIPEWPIIQSAAEQAQLRIITFGRHPDSNARLTDYDPATGLAKATIGNNEVNFTVGSMGLHMAMNGLACLTVIDALSLDINAALPLTGLFQPPSGRGDLLEVALDNRKIHLINDAYNANPGSMQAALDRLNHSAASQTRGRKILVLGDMLELGDDSEQCHQDLVPKIQACNPDSVFLVGKQMAGIFHPLRESGIRCSSHDDHNSCTNQLAEELEQGDLVLLKGSHATGLHHIVRQLHDRS
ncbi:hypothetical protein AVO43_14105 [Microbulbifer sp. ZGT114]|nr:hypothetical protein AVO43_14105 [Microbulbifer sp. ZGT114]